MSKQIEEQRVTINCLELIQPIGKFYLGVIDYTDLEFISFVDVRRLETKTRVVEEYIGIQRPLEDGRVKEIGKYVNLIDATFPSTIIMSISSKNVEYNPHKKQLSILREQTVAKVLDGQHRIAGLNECGLPGSKFQLAVAIFVDMELEDQALVFATINKTQTKVNKSLPYDLFEFAKTRSPQRTGHSIARALNLKKGSPFEDKIKILGVADDKEKETITQATFVEALLPYITKDKMTDRDIYRRGKTPQPYDGKEYSRYCLRPLFLKEKDSDIAQAIWNYFTVVQNKWPNSWKKVEMNKILNRSTGFIALMRFFGDIIRHYNHFETPISQKEIEKIFETITLKDDIFTKDEYVPGSGGQSKLYAQLKEMGNFV